MLYKNDLGQSKMGDQVDKDYIIDAWTRVYTGVGKS